MDKPMTMLFTWDKPSMRIDSVYGDIPYIDFLEKEENRINKVKGRCAEIRQKRGFCSLWVNRIAR